VKLKYLPFHVDQSCHENQAYNLIEESDMIVDIPLHSILVVRRKELPVVDGTIESAVDERV
jgi:hypothetical protein